MITKENRAQFSLLLLRWGVFSVMFVWALDKFINPVHAGKVFEKFYGLAGLGSEILLAIGVLQMLLVVGFVLGIFKRYTYGSVLFMHLISTLSSYNNFLHPYEGSNLLFFAALPMLSACVALYLFRDEDTWGTVKI